MPKQRPFVNKKRPRGAVFSSSYIEKSAGVFRKYKLLGGASELKAAEPFKLLCGIPHGIVGAEKAFVDTEALHKLAPKLGGHKGKRGAGIDVDAASCEHLGGLVPDRVAREMCADDGKVGELTDDVCKPLGVVLSVFISPICKSRGSLPRMASYI